jgi:hypothetical protein
MAELSEAQLGDCHDWRTRWHANPKPPICEAKPVPLIVFRLTRPSPRTVRRTSCAALDNAHVAKAIEAAGPSGFAKSPEDVASVIARMCHPEPGERYQRMEEVKDDLAIIGQ